MLVEQYGPARGIVIGDLVQISVLARPLAPFGGGLHLKSVVGVEESELAGLKGLHAGLMICATLCEPVRGEVVEERRIGDQGFILDAPKILDRRRWKEPRLVRRIAHGS